uniref:MFS domain-containing protein n=1 Tax=Angiostrongylus cantonensis TaxID=6313 RepID=A0A158P977_ANGCA
RAFIFTLVLPRKIDLVIALDSTKRSDEDSSWTRYAVLCATIICLSSVMANMVCFNFTVLCMPATHEVLAANETYYHGYSKKDRTWLFSAVAVGALISVVPTSLAIATIGTRHVFFAAGMLTAVATALIPFAAHNSLNAFLVLRFLQGVSCAACMPTVGAVTSSWASLKQHGLFMSALTTFGQLSAVFAMPVAGELCSSSLGWEAVFYVHAVVTFTSFVGWFFLYTNNPEDHPLVSKHELAVINSGKSTDSKRTIPYLEILTTPSVWGVWIGALGDLIAVQLIHTFSPLYIREVLQYSVEHTGFAAAVPVLFQFFVKVFAGHSSDQIRRVSETTKLRIFNSIALGFSAIFLCGLAFVRQGNGVLGIVLITLATAMFGFNGGGFNKCATLVSRQYSHFVMANIQFIWCLSLLICPILVSGTYLLPTGSVEEWRLVYLAHAAVLVLSNAVFCLLATAKPAPWTDPSITNPSTRNTPMIARRLKV